jgi:hypothetical protein
VPYSPAELGSAILGFADDYNTRLTQACDDIGAAAPDLETRTLFLQDKIATVNATLTIATSPNPVVSLLDMTVYVTLKRLIFEEQGSDERLGPKAADLAAMLQRGEQEIWRIAGTVLTPAQQEELRELIRRWRQDHPGQRYVSHIRFAEFNRYRYESTPSRGPRASSVFQLLYLDPLAGADPVAQEIHETRMLAERMYFYAARIPGVLRWQVQLLYQELLLKPESQQLLADLSKLAAASDKAASTVEGLAPSLRRELDGAVSHALQGIAKERQAILDALESQSEALRPLVADLRSTMDAGERMATAVDGGVKSLDGFVGRFVPATAPAAEGKTSPAAARSADEEADGRPFDVLDYGKAASQIREAAAELRELIGSVDRTLADPAAPGAARLSQAAAEVEASASTLLTRAFVYALVLVILVLVALPISLRIARRRTA